MVDEVPIRVPRLPRHFLGVSQFNTKTAVKSLGNIAYPSLSDPVEPIAQYNISALHFSRTPLNLVNDPHGLSVAIALELPYSALSIEV